MTRSFFLAASIAAMAVTCAACGTDRGGMGAGGAGGASSSSTTTSSTGSTSSTTSTTSSTTSTGTGTGTSCTDPTNPMFNSCLVPFLAGCWMPDESGTCTDMNGTVSWSDGSKYVTQGSMPGIYGPNDTAPCISMVIANGALTGTKGTEVLHFDPVPGTQTAKITCPDGSSFTATDDQVTAFNVCQGLNCP